MNRTILIYLKFIIFLLVLITCSHFNNFLKCENIWKPTKGPYGGRIDKLIADKDGNLLALTSNYGLQKVYKSTNNGEDWTFLKRDSINTISITPDGNYLIGGMTGSIDLYNKDFQFIKKVRNIEFIYGEPIERILITNKGIIYADFLYSNFLVSSDNGNTWDYRYFSDKYLYIDAVDSLGNFFSLSSRNYIFRSEMNDTSWVKINVFDSTNFEDIQRRTGFCYNKIFNTLVLYYSNGKIYTSSDNGLKWILTKDSLPFDDGWSRLSVDEKGIMYLSDSKQIYQSVDGGYKWEKIIELNNILITSLIPHGDRLYLLVYDKGIMSYNFSTKQIKKINKGIVNSDINEISIAKNGYVFAIGISGVYRSTNNGDEWEELGFEMPVYNDSPKIIADKDGNIYLSSSFELYRSTDLGKTWTNFQFTNPVNDIKINDNDVVYVAGNGLLHSSDGCKTWSRDSLPPGNYTTVDVAGDNFILVGNYQRYSYLSKDGGLNWRTLSPEVPEQYGSKVKFSNKLDIFIDLNMWSSGSICYFSKDTGNTFNILNTPNESYQRINLLKADVGIFLSVYNPSVWTLAPNNNSLYLSTDTGNSWKIINDGLEDVFLINCLNNNGSTYFLGTVCDGIYRCDNFTYIDDLNDKKSPLHCISPNPATDFISISLLNPMLKQGVDKVEIYDIMGVLYTPPNPLLIDGEQLRLDVSGFVPGVYFVKVGDRVQRFVKL